MIDRDMIRTFLEGAGANGLLFISMATFGDAVNIICHIAVTAGTLLLMYKQYKKHTK